MLRSIKAVIPNILKRNCIAFVCNIADSIRYYRDSGYFFHNSPLKDRAFANVIFICKGNVCRSAFAEHRLKNLLGQDQIRIDSGGLDVDQGGFPPKYSVTVAAEFDCSLADRRAKGLQDCDMEGADLILAMEYWQYQRLVQLYPEKKESILLLRSLAPFPYCLFCNIADPFGWDENEFRRIYLLVDRALAQIIRWR